MKLLVASCFDEPLETIKQQLNRSDLTAELTLVASADEVLLALSKERYDGLLSDYTLNDIDIWRLSALVQSACFAEYSIPLYLVQGSGDPEIPHILANEYHFKVIAVEDIIDALKTPVILDDFKPRLLIIEDEPDAANIAMHALKTQYTIDIARDGQTGFEQWLKRRHDLILLDLMLPGLSGDQVLAKILAIDNDQPVIIVTAFSDSENHKNLMINGASEFLGKPYSLTDLRKLCQNVYHRAKLVSEIHYREDKFKHLSHQFWLMAQCLAKNDIANGRRVMQRIQAIIPVGDPSEDEQFKLLQSVALR